MRFMVLHVSSISAAEDKRSGLRLFFFLRSSSANPFSVDLAYFYLLYLSNVLGHASHFNGRSQ
jgi:hypothetical protein